MTKGRKIQMATSLLNRAQISYTYGGAEGAAVSNQTTTTLVDQYTMTAVKETLTPEVRASFAALICHAAVLKPSILAS